MAILTTRAFALEAASPPASAQERAGGGCGRASRRSPVSPAPEHGPEEELAWKLEWLRRAASLMAAVRLRGAGESRAEVLQQLQRAGHMSPERAAQELNRVEHPLWGTYLYTYWLGRHLVEEADRRAGSAARGAAYLGWLYGGLHLPDRFASESARVLTPSRR
jgi:hypothetical protein